MASTDEQTAIATLSGGHQSLVERDERENFKASAKWCLNVRGLAEGLIEHCRRGDRAEDVRLVSSMNSDAGRTGAEQMLDRSGGAWFASTGAEEGWVIARPVNADVWDPAERPR